MHLLGAVNSQDIDMLSVSGLQAALKRRNSKVLRDNSSAQSSADTRRFSSGEVLGSHLQSPSVLAPSVATVSKKSSFSRRIRKVSTGNNQAEALDSCTLLDMHIAQIKRKLADFREEDVEISERVEELTNSLSDLCQGYHIPSVTPYSDSDPTNHLHYNTSVASMHYNITVTPALESNSQGDSADDEDFQKFCVSHPHLAKQRNSCQLGYSTLPPPPNRYRERVNQSATSVNCQPVRSHSYDGKDLTNYCTTQHRPLLAPRNSYPQGDNHPSFTYREREYRFRSPREDYGRPVSYQEISYEEDDYYEQHNPEDSSWTDLSCP